VRLAQAIDFRDESDTLHRLLRTLSRSAWEECTQFKGWTAYDIVGHLHLFNYAARVTVVEGPEALRRFMGAIAAARNAGESLTGYTRRWLAGIEGAELLRRWHDFYLELAELYADLDPARRVAWGGPDMSVRSCISARQMETWAHGQAVFDRCGEVRTEHDRIRNIAVMGMNTFGWTFTNRALEIPANRPFVRLVSPSGAVWEWNPPAGEERIEGSAVEFCQVVTQTRNVADTRLEVFGATAKAWMANAQCFAGAPHPPPAPGTRFLQH
jgi:uncharacterized protein (TIGR03084 family)